MSDQTSPVDHLARLLESAQRLIAGVRPDQWTAPTPCTDWNVRDLVNHIVRGNRLFAAAARGEQPNIPPAGTPPPVTDVLGEDPVGAFRASADALLEAFARPGVMQATVTVPFGSVPGAVALHLRNTELLVHGWDLARATGQSTDFPEEAARQELEFSRGSIGQIPPGRAPFAPPRPVADDAPALDQLAALLGRQV